MKASPQQHSFGFHNLGIGDIQLGKRPSQIAGMVPFNRFTARQRFTVLPHASRYYVFNGGIRGTIESPESGIDIRHVFASINEDGYINRIFLYPQQVNDRIAGRLSQLYGEPSVGNGAIGGELIGTHNFWITESETEVAIFSPVSDTETATVISFRFFHDLPALKDYNIAVETG